ncbi:MAG: hypothetical protein MUP85_24500 [Candidatus Lokiarchaeota archaeon]|nr:hypothetical protein [Candidatus Lokiarchaeota archaeon]
MEGFLPIMKEKFKEKIEIKEDKQNLTITLMVKGDIFGKFLYPDEIPIILKLYGGLKEALQMEIIINEKDQKVDIILENEDDFMKIQSIMKNIWENAVDLLAELLKGNYESIKDVSNIDD